MNITSYIGKRIKIKIDRPLGSKHPIHGFEYPVNYGFVPDTVGGDDEEIDAYLLGIDKPVTEYEGVCIAIIHRLNDNDDKLIVVPRDEILDDKTIKEMTHFQEKYFKFIIIRNH